MKNINDFKNKKIELNKFNNFFGGTECCDVIDTDNGDTTKTWYNEDGTVCCTETQNQCIDL